MEKSVKRIAVTGGAGQIAYSTLFRIASGEMLGGDQPIALHILEVPEALEALKGVVMELQDCAYPLLKEIIVTSDPYQAFEGIEIALLIGAKPRGPGMERKDLLRENAGIFSVQGKALSEKAASGALILVVGNPCNTNALITLQNGPNLDPEKIFAMTRLDQNRAAHQLAEKAGVSIDQVSQMTIWGNHSSTQVPDFSHAKIGGKPLEEVISDRAWLEQTFFETVQKRGAAVIAARGKSSAASAAHAAISTIKNLHTPSSEWFSVGKISDQNPYGIEKGLIFSFPCTCPKEGEAQIIPDLKWSPFIEQKIKTSEKELIDEKASL